MLVATALLALAVNAGNAGAVPPSIPQYSLTVPGADGPKDVGSPSAQSSGRPQQLSPEASKALDASGDLALRRVATAPELGAPPTDSRPVKLELDEPGFLASAGRGLGGGALLLGALAVGVLALVLFSRRRGTGQATA